MGKFSGGRSHRMAKLSLFVIGFLATAFVIPVHGDQGQATQDKVSQINLHIGGGIGVPLNSTGKFAGVSGTFQAGAGPNLGKHHSIVGEFMWHGLPPNRNSLLPILNAICLLNPPANPNLPCSLASINATDNLYALTANYLYHREGRLFGYYATGGGGWYYRRAELKNFTAPSGTPCVPAWTWWGYVCQGGSVVLGSSGISSGGVNGGVGVTVGQASGFKFYIEARYHYSPQGGRISTHVLPVTLGVRW
jgi:hypothetical protein